MKKWIKLNESPGFLLCTDVIVYFRSNYPFETIQFTFSAVSMKVGQGLEKYLGSEFD